ncbi:MAG: flagellar protein FlaG [Bryobacterales bacterium]|nr:flagellar protein FlaG [Bryobacterales bacterium]
MELSASRIQLAAPAGTPVHERRLELQQQQQLIQAVKKVNETELRGSNQELRIVVDEDSRKPAVWLVDRETQEVLQQYPPKSIFRRARKMA